MSGGAGGSTRDLYISHLHLRSSSSPSSKCSQIGRTQTVVCTTLGTFLLLLLELHALLPPLFSLLFLRPRLFPAGYDALPLLRLVHLVEKSDHAAARERLQLRVRVPVRGAAMRVRDQVRQSGSQ